MDNFDIDLQTEIVALHDLNAAAMGCNGIIVLEVEIAVAFGTPAEVLNEAPLREVVRDGAEVGAKRPESAVRLLRLDRIQARPSMPARLAGWRRHFAIIGHSAM